MVKGSTKFKSFEEIILFIEKEAQRRYEDVMRKDANKLKPQESPFT